MSDSGARVVIVLRQRPPAKTVMRLHRLLGLGVADVLRHIENGAPLLNRELVRNDRIPLAALVRELLFLIEPFSHNVYVVPSGEQPSDRNDTTPQALLTLLSADVEPPEAVRPVPNAELAAFVAGATRAALAELPRQVRDNLCLVALVTTGEALRPYLSLTRHGDDPWGLADSPYAVAGDAHFAALSDRWDLQGNLAEMDQVRAEAEFVNRLATLEEALRLLDVHGEFGLGETRRRVLLLVTTMPPDPHDAGYARRLNPPGPLLERWLDEAAEGPAYAPQTPLADGTTIYSPEDLLERNETFEVAEYSPGWVLVGDDSGGSGYLVRQTGPGFDPAVGRAGAEVFRLDLGALTKEVEDVGEFVTDDLIGWLAGRQG